MGMHFYWCCDQFRQKQFHVHWKQVKHIFSDNPYKHNSTKHQISFWPTYVHNTIQKHTKIYLNYQKYEQHCKDVLKYIVRQLFSKRWIKNIQLHQCPLHPGWTNQVILYDNLSIFLNQTDQTHQLEPTASFECSIFENKKYAVRHKLTL